MLATAATRPLEQIRSRAHPGPCTATVHSTARPRVDGRIAYAYDDQGRVISIAYDGDGDGRPSQRQTLFYAAGGSVTVRTYRDGDGTPAVTVHSDDGNLMRIDRECAIPVPGVGVECVFDDDGNLLLRSVRHGSPRHGVRRRRDTTRYDYACWTSPRAAQS